MKNLIFLSLFIIIPKSYSSLQYEDFLLVKESVEKTFHTMSESHSEILIVNEAIPNIARFWWDQNEIHASYSGVEIDGILQHRIFLFGGLIRFEATTLDSLALTACHELGHGLAGAPLKDGGSSTEGQSDYFSSGECLRIMFDHLPMRNSTKDPYIIDFCSRHSDDIRFCERAMEALKADIELFKIEGNDSYLDDEAIEVAKEINTTPRFYPSAQCRIDTMVHGILKAERPKCWYPNGIKRIK